MKYRTLRRLPDCVSSAALAYALSLYEGIMAAETRLVTRKRRNREFATRKQLSK